MDRTPERRVCQFRHASYGGACSFEPTGCMMFLSYTFDRGHQMCEAEERNLRALFVLENEWGCGRIDIGMMKHILRGTGGEYEPDCEEPTHARTG
jgi:hypothetical protein